MTEQQQFEILKGDMVLSLDSHQDKVIDLMTKIKAIKTGRDLTILNVESLDLALNITEMVNCLSILKDFYIKTEQRKTHV